MPKGITALLGAGKVKRVALTTFWLAFISAATRHDLLLGMVLYLIAAVTVVTICVSPMLLAGGLLLAWYWHRHHRLPGWLVRRAPAPLRCRLAAIAAVAYAADARVPRPSPARSSPLASAARARRSADRGVPGAARAQPRTTGAG